MDFQLSTLSVWVEIRLCRLSLVLYKGTYTYAYNYRENYLEGDPTCVYNAAQALRTIQQLYGIIPRVFGKGNAAKQVGQANSKFRINAFCQVQFA